jgi:hypothetical protein
MPILFPLFGVAIIFAIVGLAALLWKYEKLLSKGIPKYLFILVLCIGYFMLAISVIHGIR